MGRRDRRPTRACRTTLTLSSTSLGLSQLRLCDSDTGVVEVGAASCPSGRAVEGWLVPPSFRGSAILDVLGVRERDHLGLGTYSHTYVQPVDDSAPHDRAWVGPARGTNVSAARRCVAGAAPRGSPSRPTPTLSRSGQDRRQRDGATLPHLFRLTRRPRSVYSSSSARSHRACARERLTGWIADPSAGHKKPTFGRDGRIVRIVRISSFARARCPVRRGEIRYDFCAQDTGAVVDRGDGGDAMTGFGVSHNEEPWGETGTRGSWAGACPRAKGERRRAPTRRSFE